MTVRFQILVTGTRVLARVELGGGTGCNKEIVKFEVLAENPGGVFMMYVKVMELEVENESSVGSTDVSVP